MENKAIASQESHANPSGHQTSLNNKKCKIAITILVMFCILGIASNIVCCCLLIGKNNEIGQLRTDLEEKEQYIASISNSTDGSNDINRPSTDGESDVPSNSESTDGLYWELNKIGMRIPVTQELFDNITLAELDNGYRLDLNLLMKYRDQGYCADGGSTAFGSIMKTNVSRGFVQDDPIAYDFVNNVIYPKTYIAYNWYGELTECWDLGEGGQARHDEVEKLVQQLQDPLTQAIEKIEPIK